MRPRIATTCLLLGLLMNAIALWNVAEARGASNPTPPYNRQTAARFLDSRETWWQNWPRARKDQGTVCISCHTQLPYALVRPTLHRELGDPTSADEKAMLDSIEKRVSLWSDIVPFYTDAKNGPGKTFEARATEAVLNSIILASYDTARGQLRPITRTSFTQAWATQETAGDLAGSWRWQNFHLGPWEGDESGYQATALLLLEALNAPGGFAKEPATRTHLDLMRSFLRTHYATQPLVNQLYVLWASAKDRTLLPDADRNALLAAIRSAQQNDGGWRVMALDPRKRIDDSPEPTESDGYATGLAVLALEEAGTRRSDPALRHGLAWLAANQQKDGAWLSSSINKHREPQTDPALFMTDAATAYALLALDRQR